MKLKLPIISSILGVRIDGVNSLLVFYRFNRHGNTDRSFIYLFMEGLYL